MLNYFFGDTLANFRRFTTEQIIGAIASENKFDTNSNTTRAWMQEIVILKDALSEYEGYVFLSFQYLEWGAVWTV